MLRLPLRRGAHGEGRDRTGVRVRVGRDEKSMEGVGEYIVSGAEFWWPRTAPAGCQRYEHPSGTFVLDLLGSPGLVERWNDSSA